MTLKKCRISLATCPASVILSTSRFRVPLGWLSRFWIISHPEVGGCSDGRWRLYSAHRTDFTSVPSSSTDPSLPSGNIRRVLCATASGCRNMVVPSITETNVLDTLCLLQGFTPNFVVPSIFPLRVGFGGS